MEVIIEEVSLYDKSIRSFLVYEENLDEKIDTDRRNDKVHYLLSTLQTWEEIVLRLRFGINKVSNLEKPSYSELREQFPREFPKISETLRLRWRRRLKKIVGDVKKELET